MCFVLEASGGVLFSGAVKCLIMEEPISLDILPRGSAASWESFAEVGVCGRSPGRHSMGVVFGRLVIAVKCFCWRP